VQNIETIEVKLPHQTYPIYVGYNIISHLSEILKNHGIEGKIAVISTPPVSKLYLHSVKEAIGNGWQVYTYDVSDGEKSKSLTTVNEIYSWLISNNFERRDTILTLGGGVVGDLAGFVAATFLRGVKLIHFPTSLLAQVDSSIGGKVGVNHKLGKNLIGAFYQPQFVFSDISVLKTLPEDEYDCGLGEVVKYGIIMDPDLFSVLEKQRDLLLIKNPKITKEVVVRCAKIKAQIVEQDEKESGIRAILNLGHTFGHALETFYLYQGLKHGQAVLLGIKCALSVSQSMEIVDSANIARINNLIAPFNIKLPPNITMPSSEQLYLIMKKDKKVRGGKINLILINKIGQVCQKQIDDKSLIIKSFDILKREL
jgi:3-dehydroquinate synthase